MKQTRNGVSSLDKALSGATDGVGTALQQAGSSYDTIAKQIDAAFADVGSQSPHRYQNKLTDMQSKWRLRPTALESMLPLYEISPNKRLHCPWAEIPLPLNWNAAADQTTKAQQSMQQAATALGDAGRTLANSTADADYSASRSEITNRCRQTIRLLRASDTYKSTLETGTEQS